MCNPVDIVEGIIDFVEDVVEVIVDLVEDVIGWLESAIDMKTLQAKLDQEIYDKKNPVNEYLNPNWN